MAMNGSFEYEEDREEPSHYATGFIYKLGTRKLQQIVHMLEICENSSSYSTYSFQEYQPLLNPVQIEVGSLKKRDTPLETLEL